jgi:hypothetical protein
LHARRSTRNARSPSAITTITAPRGGRGGELGVSFDEDLLPEPSWSGDVANAVVDWSNMSRLSSLSPPRGAEVSSSRRPREAGHDKTVGSS